MLGGHRVHEPGGAARVGTLVADKDRHECIGHGFIGVDAFQRIVTHPALRDLPFILETPNELPGYAAEIKLLRELAERE